MSHAEGGECHESMMKLETAISMVSHESFKKRYTDIGTDGMTEKASLNSDFFSARVPPIQS